MLAMETTVSCFWFLCDQINRETQQQQTQQLFYTHEIATSRGGTTLSGNRKRFSICLSVEKKGLFAKIF